MFEENKFKPVDLPEWVDMGETQQVNATPFVDALKKRLNNPMAKASGASSDMATGKVIGAGTDMGKGGGIPAQQHKGIFKSL